jgi:hypothetical protein
MTMQDSGANAPRERGGLPVAKTASSWPGLTRLDPAIHVLMLSTKDVDARDKPGHDEAER